MKIWKYLLILYLLLVFCTTGCGVSEIGNSQTGTMVRATHEIEVSATNYAQSDMWLYYERPSYTLSLYEPPAGCYTGAYILANKTLNFDIEAFDLLTEKNHSTAVYNLRLGEAYPVDWVLECLTQMKTPHIVIHPPNDYMPFQENLLVETAQSFGSFYTPIFVEFYPNPAQYGDPDAYIRFYRHAREAFHTYAGNAAFVFGLSSDQTVTSFPYYPGDAYVDWVGLQLYMPLYKDGRRVERDYIRDIETVYYQYQVQKPLMISQLAISHYSTFNNQYFSNESAMDLVTLYQTIQRDYPRIKAVNYMDFNAIDLSPELAERDNFKISSDEEMLEAYRKVIKSNHFLSELCVADSGSKQTELMRSAFALYDDEKDLYVSENVLLYELGAVSVASLSQHRVMINQMPYYPLNLLESYFSYSVVLDEDNHKIIVSTLKEPASH